MLISFILHVLVAIMGAVRSTHQPEVAGVRLAHPVMNAAGTCKLIEDVDRLVCSRTAAIMVGTITKEPRTPNSGQVYWALQSQSLNSRGLPNPGLPYYRQHMGEIAKKVHS